MISKVIYILTILFYGLGLVFYVKHYAVDPKYSVPSLIFWLISLLLSSVLIFISAKREKHPIESQRKTAIQVFRRHYLFVLPFVMGFLLRFVWVTTIPILTHDEGKDTGLYPIKILTGELTNYFGFNAGINNIFFAVAAIPHLFFTDPVMKVRFFSFFFGSLTIALIYIYVSAISSKRAGLIAAWLLAFYHVHIHFSRSEFLILFDSFYSLVILLAFLFVARRMNKASIILFGLVLGVGMHFYSGLRVIIGLSALLFFALLLVRYSGKKIISGLLVFLIFFLVGLGPTIYEFIRNPHDSKAIGTAVILNTKEKGWSHKLINNYIVSLKAYTFSNIDFHYGYGGPFMIFPFAIVFYLGIVKMLTKLKNNNYILILLGLLLIPLFNSAILNNLNFTHRLLSLVPLIIITCTMGVEIIADILTKFFNKKLTYALVFVLLAIFAYYNIDVYFFKQVWRKVVGVNDFRSDTASQIIRSYDPSVTTVYFLGNEAMPRYDATPTLPYKVLDYKISNIEDKSILLEKKDYKNTTILIILPANSAKFAEDDIKTLERKGFVKTSYKEGSEYLFDVLILQKPLKKA